MGAGDRQRTESTLEDMPTTTAETIYAEFVRPYLEVIRRERTHFGEIVVDFLADRSYQAAYLDAWTRCCSTSMGVITGVLINTLLRAATDPGSSLELRMTDEDQTGVRVGFSDGSEVLVSPSLHQGVRITFCHQKNQWYLPALEGPSPPILSQLPNWPTSPTHFGT